MADWAGAGGGGVVCAGAGAVVFTGGGAGGLAGAGAGAGLADFVVVEGAGEGPCEVDFETLDETDAIGVSVGAWASVAAFDTLGLAVAFAFREPPTTAMIPPHRARPPAAAPKLMAGLFPTIVRPYQG